MDTVDDLMTPGCPNCAVKHLSAALAYIVGSRIDAAMLDDCDRDSVLVAKAIVNLVESRLGYPSHFHYAVGLLATAESESVTSEFTSYAEKVRRNRLQLTVDGAKAVPEVIDDLLTMVDGADLACAHLDEARRELPEGRIPRFTTVDDLVETIEGIRGEYFEFDKPGEKGGE